MKNNTIEVKVKANTDDLNKICVVECTNYDCKHHIENSPFCNFKSISLDKNGECSNAEYKKCSNCHGNLRTTNTGLACEICHQPGIGDDPPAGLCPICNAGLLFSMSGIYCSKCNYTPESLDELGGYANE